MHFLSASKILLAGAFALAAISVSANADPLPAKWGTTLEDYLPVWDKACAGDTAALQSMKDGIRQTNHPAIKNLLYVLLVSKECTVYTGHTAQTRALLEEAALEDGFPISQSNLGGCYLNADCGYRRDPQQGERLLRSALYGGYGLAGLYLASAYLDEKYFPLQVDKLVLAEDYLNLAEKEGVPVERINEARGDLERVSSNPEKALEYYRKAKPSKYITYRIKQVEDQIAGNAAEAANTPVFAALAASTADGGYGFSNDQTSAKDAEVRALAECRSRNAAGNCSTKLVLEGRGCAAYAYAPGGSPFGWGTSRDKDAAMNRAADECRTRNGNRSCSGGTVWACNTRPAKDLAVLFEAKNDSGPAQTAGAGLFNPGPAPGACPVIFRHICTNFAGDTYNNPGSSRHGKRLDNLRIYGLTKATINLPGCEAGKVIFVNWYEGKWGSGQDERLPGSLKAKVKDALFNFRAHVQAKYPQCGDFGTDMFIGLERSTNIKQDECRSDNPLQSRCETYTP